MANTKVAKEFYEVSKLSKYDFEPYWPDKKLKICVTGAGGFIASHLAKRLKSEGHYIIGCDWKRNEHMPVCATTHLAFRLVRTWCVYVELTLRVMYAGGDVL